MGKTTSAQGQAPSRGSEGRLMLEVESFSSQLEPITASGDAGSHLPAPPATPLSEERGSVLGESNVKLPPGPFLPSAVPDSDGQDVQGTRGRDADSAKEPFVDTGEKEGGKDLVLEQPASPSGGSQAFDLKNSQEVITHISSVDLRRTSFAWLTNPYVCWRHPIARILVAWLILVLDMYLYAEDPVNDSHIECNLPGLGHLYGFVLVWPSSVGLVFLRLILLALSTLAGVVLGRQFVHHWLLRDRLHLEMFDKCNGSWFIIGLCSTGTLFVGCQIHNLIEYSNADAQITGATGMEMRTFAKLAQICSVTADLVAILMVTDAVLQDRTFYPNWARCLKWLWMDACRGWIRLLVTWLVAVGGVLAAVMGIISTGKDLDDIRWTDRNIGGLTETARAFLMSCVVFCDIFTVVQDWQFPSFAVSMDIPLDQQVFIAGTWVTEIQCNALSRCAHSCLSCCPRRLCTCSCRSCSWLWKILPDKNFFRIQITGPWLTYGPLLIVMCIDLFCTRTQLIYSPESYGQYVDADQQVWAIQDEAYLLEAYDEGVLRPEKTAMITFDARWNVSTGEALSASAAGDVMLTSRYSGSWVKYLAAAPGFLFMVLFFILVWAANKRRGLLVSVADMMDNAVSLASSAARSLGSAIASPGNSNSGHLPLEAEEDKEPNGS